MATALGKLRTKSETAKQLGISIATLDRLIAAGRIEYFKVGWHVRFSEAQIEDYLRSTLNAPRRWSPGRQKAEKARQSSRKVARQRTRKAA